MTNNIHKIATFLFVSLNPILFIIDFSSAYGTGFHREPREKSLPPAPNFWRRNRADMCNYSRLNRRITQLRHGAAQKSFGAKVLALSLFCKLLRRRFRGPSIKYGLTNRNCFVVLWFRNSDIDTHTNWASFKNVILLPSASILSYFWPVETLCNRMQTYSRSEFMDGPYNPIAGISPGGFYSFTADCVLFYSRETAKL